MGLKLSNLKTTIEKSASLNQTYNGIETLSHNLWSSEYNKFKSDL